MCIEQIGVYPLDCNFHNEKADPLKQILSQYHIFETILSKKKESINSGHITIIYV